MRFPLRFVPAHRIRSSPMLVHFLQAGFGGASSQLINFVGLPVIARLYSPNDYAAWALIIAAGTILGSLANLRFELAIVLPSDEREASSLFWGSLLIALAIVSVVYVGGSVIADPTAQFIGIDLRQTTLRIIALFAFSFAVYQSLRYWNIRFQRFALNSVAQVIFASSTLFIQVVWALLYRPTPTGLILGTLVGQLVALTVLAVKAIGDEIAPRINAQILRESPIQLQKHRKFPLYSTPYTFFGILRDRAVLFVLEVFAGSTQVGLYAFAFRIMNFPVTLVSNSLRPVLFQESAAQGVKAIEIHIYRILRFLVVVTAPFLVVYLLFAEELFRLVFGARWVEAGHIGRFIVLPIYTFLFVNWMDRLLDVLGEQRTALVLEVIFASAAIAGLLMGFISGLGLDGALMIQAAVLVAYNLTYLWVAYDRAGFRRVRLLRIAGYGALSAVASLLVVAPLRIWVFP